VEVVVVEGVFFRFSICRSVQELFAIKVGFCKNRPNFACFWPPIFLGGRPPEFLEWNYKTQPDSDHVAKFQSDRSRELGD